MYDFNVISGLNVKSFTKEWAFMNRFSKTSTPGQQITRKKFLKNFFFDEVDFLFGGWESRKKFRFENEEDRIPNFFFWLAKFRRQVAEKSFGFHIFAQNNKK